MGSILTPFKPGDNVVLNENIIPPYKPILVVLDCFISTTGKASGKAIFTALSDGRYTFDFDEENKIGYYFCDEFRVLDVERTPINKTSMDYHEFVKRENIGKILVGVDPAIARRFFTETDHAKVQKLIGEPLFIERFIVKACFYLEWILLPIIIVISIFVLKWFSILAIPIILFLSFFLGSQASIGKQNISGAVVFAGLCVVAAFLFREKGVVLFLWLMLLPLPYLFATLTYKLATIFMRNLSIRNEIFYNVYLDKGIFIKEL